MSGELVEITASHMPALRLLGRRRFVRRVGQRHEAR